MSSRGARKAGAAGTWRRVTGGPRAAISGVWTRVGERGGEAGLWRDCDDVHIYNNKIFKYNVDIM